MVRVVVRVLLLVALLSGPLSAQSRSPVELANASVPGDALRGSRHRDLEYRVSASGQWRWLAARPRIATAYRSDYC